MRILLVFSVTFLLTLSLLGIYGYDSGENSDRTEALLYMIGELYTSPQAERLIDELSTMGVRAHPIIQLNAGLHARCFKKADPEAFEFVESIMRQETGKPINLSEVPNVYAFVDILGMDSSLIRTIFGSEVGDSGWCIISRPLLSALSEPPCAATDGILRAEVLTPSYPVYECRIVGVFEPSEFISDYSVIAPLSDVEAWIRETGSSDAATTRILIEHKGSGDLEAVRELIGCRNCLVPVGFGRLEPHSRPCLEG